MKSNAPWSVKGIERDARETAKEAARREGMTVGEWLNQVIYTAGDPETSNGEIEGLKTSDLVNAIEHLNKRVINAESKSAAAIDELSRNFGGAVERLQRLERVKPVTGSAPDIAERLERLEAKTNDRSRIEALRALEKAVGQVALQFDAAQKTTGVRLESTERQLQQFASRLDNAAVSGDDSAAEAIGYLKDTIDGMSARIARAERIASEASKLKADAAGTVDAEFVERTGERLRILGDEIKRGGDQIKTLEGSIRKFSEQIDAAERRSSEGVQKVAETISELRTQFAQSDAPEPADTRQELEAAMAAVTQQTDDRINKLQRSFESMIERLEGPGSTATRDEMKIDLDDEARDDDDFGDAAPDAEADDDDLSAFDLETPDDDTDGDDDDLDAVEAADDGNDDDAFAFDLEDDASASAASGGDAPAHETNAAASLLQEVEDAFAGATPSQEPEPAAEPEGDGIDAILAELEGLTSETAAEATGAADEKASEDSERDGAAADQAKTAPSMNQGYLQEARRAAKEAAERAAAESAAKSPRRKLTPKQRAILAAKIRRKRLAEQGLDVDRTLVLDKADTDGTAAPAKTDAEDKEHGGSLLTKVTGAISALRARLPGAGKEDADDDAAARAAKTDPAPARSRQDRDDDGNPNLARTAREAARKVGAKPVTVALGAAILLAGAALFFLARDLMFGGDVKVAKDAGPAQTSRAVTDETAQPQAADATVPEAPSAPVTQPRALYLDSVAKLKAAANDADTRAALKGLEQAAALGHPPAQLQLGELYKLGQGVDQDPAQARAWYERAANGGNVLAMHRIGVMAARGQGGPTDQAVAIKWFEKASNLGLIDSQYNLGAIYHPGGEGSPNPTQDQAKAYYWYALAARNGDEQAGTLAAGLATGLPTNQRREIDASVAAWKAETPDPDANEIAPAS